MGERVRRIRREFTSTAALVLVAYSLYRSVAYASYVTNFGGYADALGYVSTIPFMAGASAGNLASSITVLVLYLKGRLKPYALDYKAPLAVLALTYCIVALFPHVVNSPLSFVGPWAGLGPCGDRGQHRLHRAVGVWRFHDRAHRAACRLVAAFRRGLAGG